MIGPPGLCAAVLKLGIHDFRRGHPPDAGEWLFSDRDEGVFDFVNVCEVLGLSPEAVRKAARNGSGSLPPGASS